jgi:septal ring factor EnvC (AmiA/AmiB activator)
MHLMVVCVAFLIACGDPQAAAEREKVEQAYVEAKKAEKAANDAMEQLERLRRDLHELDKKVAAQVDKVIAAQTDQDRQGANAQLAKLRTEKADLETRLREANRIAAQSRRRQGASISQECMDNPLAKGCM